MDWLLVAAFCIMWGAFLLPTGKLSFGKKRDSSVEDFEHGMELLAYTEIDGPQGRWIVTPRKGVRFLGHSERARARVLERRRRVFIVLLEAIGITFLVGLLPPLRFVWFLTLILGGCLGAYVYVLVSLKQRETGGVSPAVNGGGRARPAQENHGASGPNRYAPAGSGSAMARPRVNGLGAVGEGDRVHVVVRSAT